MKRQIADTSTRKLTLPKYQADVTPISGVRVFRYSSGKFQQSIAFRPSSYSTNRVRFEAQVGHVRSAEEFLQENSREVEMAWLQENQEFLATHYSGKWIALDGPEIVADADDLPTLLKLARKAGHPHPFVTAIPTHPIISIHM